MNTHNEHPYETALGCLVSFLNDLHANLGSVGTHLENCRQKVQRGMLAFTGEEVSDLIDALEREAESLGGSEVFDRLEDPEGLEIRPGMREALAVLYRLLAQCPLPDFRFS